VDLSLGNFGILIEEQDGNPSGFCTKLIASNASLTNNGDGSFTLTTGGGVSDHGALTGKLDDDHTQYGLLAGRAGGQTLIGGAASGEGLTLNSTAHATKGLVSIGGTLYVDEVNNRVGIGENVPTADFEINSTGGENIYIYRYATNANPPSIKFWKARGTEGSPSKLQAGDDTGKLEFWGYVRNAADDGDAFLRTGYIVSEVESVDAQERSKGRISFYVKTGYAITNPDMMASIEPDGFLVEKIATATAGTQYESWDLKMKCSVWDETNVQAEDRVIYWTLNAGSGVDGSEPYYLSLYDNGSIEMIRIDPLTPAILIPDYLTHLGDPNTSIYFRTDRVTIYAGGRVMIDAVEASQNILYLGHDGSIDVDVSIGPSGALFVQGDTKRISFQQTGTIQLFTYEGTVNDDAYFDLPDAVAGIGMANFNEGAEYAIFSFTDAGAVTLISNSANVANSQSDGNYCIYDSGGTAVRIENKIGSNVNVKVFVWFN